MVSFYVYVSRYTSNTYDINFDPWRCQHIVDKISLTVSPIITDLP